MRFSIKDFNIFNFWCNSSYPKMLQKSYKVLDNLRLPNGLYRASASSFYDAVWIRDCVYMSLPYMNKRDGIFQKSTDRLFQLFKDYEWKIDIHCKERPIEPWQYFHAKFSAQDVKEIDGMAWGHAQHDAIGAFLWMVGEAVFNSHYYINEDNKRIVQKLFSYLNNCKYWEDFDNSVWEENREIHSNSVGACVAAAMIWQKLCVKIPNGFIENGLNTLYSLFPRESETKEVDLAQLTLIYPYNIFTKEKAKQIVQNVEKKLLRGRGVIRYQGDQYYNQNGECEWTMGIPWLSLCHNILGDKEKAKEYLKWTESLMLHDGGLPEGYFAGTDRPNPNTPLGWSNAMYILAAEAL